MPKSAWIANNPEKYKALRKLNAQRHKVKLDAWLADFKATHPCACGESDVACLEFHHLDANAKGFNIGTRSGLRLNRLKAEIEKCEPLCANCHRKGHAGRPSCERHAKIFATCKTDWFSPKQ